MQSIDNQIDFTNLSNEQIEEIATNILKSVKDENTTD
jgi:regulator of PEP synthase PpsR (kinase-PPPase family)